MIEIVRHASVCHKIGNVVGGLCGIIDGLVIIISLGNIYLCLKFAWLKFQLKHDIFRDNE